MAREYVLQGGDGVISVTANVAPAAVAKVIASPPPWSTCGIPISFGASWAAKTSAGAR